MDAKKLLYVVPAAALLLYLVFSPGRYSVGDQVSDFSLGSLDGERISLNDYSGKVVFIEFFSTKCPVARRAFSHTGKLSARFS